MIEPATNIRALYQACDPEQSLEGGKAHPFYIDLSAARGTTSVTNRMCRAISLANDDVGQGNRTVKVLLTGHRGTGKTTELNSLAVDLEADGFFVVRFSGETEFNLNDVGWQDLLMELAAQVYQQGVAAKGAKRIGRSPNQKLLDRVENSLNNTVLTNVQTTSADLSAEGRVTASSGPWPFLKLMARFKSLWKSGSVRTREVRRDLEPQADQLIEDLNRFLSDFVQRLVTERDSAKRKKGLAVIIDGLEKMALYDTDTAMNSHVQLFIHSAPRLKAPACHVVYIMPISLEYDHNVGDYYPQLETQKLPMVRIRTRLREADQDGVKVMRELLAKRGDLEKLAEPEAVTELVAKSGGHVRDLLRLVRAACDEAMDANQERITRATAKRAINRFANGMYGQMAYEALDALVEVYQTQRLARQHGRLAQNLLVMEYRDRDDRAWNDLHPCVLELAHVKEALGV